MINKQYVVYLIMNVFANLPMQALRKTMQVPFIPDDLN